MIRFLIEYIKPRQEGEITKEFIRTHRLDQSTLRFTRFYQLPDGSYQRDEATAAYSSIMTEGKIKQSILFLSHLTSSL